MTLHMDSQSMQKQYNDRQHVLTTKCDTIYILGMSHQI